MIAKIQHPKGIQIMTKTMLGGLLTWLCGLLMLLALLATIPATVASSDAAVTANSDVLIVQPKSEP